MKIQNAFQTKILSRFLSDEELADLMEEYQASKYKQAIRFVPTPADWKAFRSSKLNVEDLRKQFKVKTKQAVYHKLGQMKILELTKQNV